MKRVQTKLAALGVAAIAVLSILAGLLLRGAYSEYFNLANFRQTTAISIAAYDLARDLTLERQYAYQASSFVGEGTRQQMNDRYRTNIDITRKSMERLRQAVSGQKQKFSSRFQKSMEEAFGSESMLDQVRNEVLDPQRDQSYDAGNLVKNKALNTYDAIIASQSNFRAVLLLETGDAELVRKIVTQDNVARLQRDIWKIKGLVSAALRDNRVNGNGIGELKSRTLSASDHASRTISISNGPVNAAAEKILQGDDYGVIVGLANKMVALSMGVAD